MQRTPNTGSSRRPRLGKTLTIAGVVAYSCLVAIILQQQARAADLIVTWNGGSGAWNSDANWTPQVVPLNGVDTFNVRIDDGNGAASTVVLDVDATISSLLIDADDSLLQGAGQDLAVVGGSVVNNGSWTIDNGTGGGSTTLLLANSSILSGNGTIVMSDSAGNQILTDGTVLTHEAGHTIRGSGVVTTEYGALVNRGAIIADGNNLPIELASLEGSDAHTGLLHAIGSRGIVVNSALRNDGTVIVENGSKVSVGGSYIQTDTLSPGTTRLEGGTIDVGIASLNVRTGEFVGFGNIRGNLLIGGNAVLRPGLPVGSLHIIGVGNSNLSIDDGDLHVDIGGRTAGTEFDQIVADGELFLDRGNVAPAVLSVTLINGFVPELGDSFEILNSSQRRGVFSSVAGTDLPNGLVFQVRYTSTSVILDVVVKPTPTASPTITSTSTLTSTATLTATATVTPSATPTATPTPEFTCDPQPLIGCREGGLGQFDIRDPDRDKSDRLDWKWKRGAANAFADFGNPTVDTPYAFCVYDEAGDVPSLVVAARIPAAGTCNTRPCWKQLGSDPRPRGFKYNNPRNLDPDGIKKVHLRVGDEGKAQVFVKGKGENLVMPGPVSGQQFFNQDSGVTVQLVNSLGICWSSRFVTPAQRNQGADVRSPRFRDKESE